MKNRGHKVKFRGGKDANKMLMRKLANNFLQRGKLETTKQKAKAVQPIVEKLVTKAKTNSEADKNYILKHITTGAVLKSLIKDIAPQLAKATSGYTRVVFLGVRQTDNAQKARLEWAYPVVLEETKKVVVKKGKKEKETGEPASTEVTADKGKN